MGSKSRQTREAQKAYWENQLNRRLSLLKEKGVEPEQIEKDLEVKRLKAEIRKTDSRLRTIAAKEKKVQDMAAAREKKAAAQEKKEKTKKEKASAEAAEMSKRQQKKRKKMEEKGAQQKSG
jgi:hypothetical protein